MSSDPRADILQMAEGLKERKNYSAFRGNVELVLERNPVRPEYVGNFRGNVSQYADGPLPEDYWLTRDWLTKTPEQNKAIDEAQKLRIEFIPPEYAWIAEKKIPEDPDA